MNSVDTYDGIVIGSGPNGLVAANLLADAGWSVLLLEEQERVGGAVHSAELVEPGFINDQFSAFYPLAAPSPVIAGMGLGEFGLSWQRGDTAVAHPRLDGTASLIARDVEDTASNFESFAPGDGESWRKLYAEWDRLGADLLGTLFTMFPPIKPLLNVARKSSPAELFDLAKLAASGARSQAEDWFAGDGGRRMLAGNALHADLSPGQPPSAVYGWVLMCLAQQVGFPVPRGGAGEYSGSMARRFKSKGGRIELGVRAERIVVEKGIARAVEWDGGAAVARKAVLADVGAPQLYRDLLDEAVVPGAVKRAMRRFQYDNATVKIDWTLDGRIPWAAEGARDAGTVHVAEGIDALDKQAAEMSRGLIPETPYLVMGQYAAIDPSRAPEGKETAWAYTHVPQQVRGDAAGQLNVQGDKWSGSDREQMVERVENEIEALAPGFKDLIRGRHVMMPPDFAGFDRNLVNGAVNGGTSDIRQQLIFRPVPGLARPETPIKSLYLASASAHPGGGAHGACGANAANAAIDKDRQRIRTLVAGALARKAQTLGPS